MGRAVLLATVFVHAFLSAHTLLLDWWPNPNHVPLFVAVEKGFCKKHGLDVEIRFSPDGGSSMANVALGTATFGVHYFPQTLMAQTSIVAAFPLIDRPLQGILLRDSGAVKTLGGYPSKLLSSIEDMLPFSAEKRVVQGDLALALHMGFVDAVFGVYQNIEQPMLRSRGIQTRFIGLAELGVPPFPELVVICKPDCTEVVPLREAVLEAIVFCRSHPDEAFDLYAQANRDKSSSVLKWEREAWKETLPLYTREGLFVKQEAEAVARWLVEKGLCAAESRGWMSDFEVTRPLK